MVKRALALVGCLFLAAALTSLTAATKLFLTQSAPGEIIVSVDPLLHQEFGLAYPVTYKFAIPPGSSNLTVSAKYQETAAWAPLTEKTPLDYFNGEQVVRFDYPGNAAYVSVGFDSYSDNIFLRVTDGSGQPVNTTFQNICNYYDNRQSVVTVTADDWEDFTNTAFIQSIHNFRSYSLPFTAAIITGKTTTPTWQAIQSELDSGLVEAASHTRTHTNPPYADPISELLGSKQDLLANLTMPPAFRKGSQGYVYTWVAPYGATTSATELVVSQAGYLIDRMTFTSTGNFTAWDTTQRRYLMDGRTSEMGPFWGGLTDLNALNALFDQSLSAGTIYHVMLHPKILADSGYWYKPWTTGHLAHISNRTNVWYVNFGTLYVYHLLQDPLSGNIEVASGPPTITGQPLSVTAHWRETATFSVDAIGSAPLAYQWQMNGTDIAGATSAIYTTPSLTQADSNTVYTCVVSNSFGSTTSNGATLSVIAPNVLANPSFESGISPWVFWTDGSGTMTQASFGTDGIKSAQVAITNPGTSAQIYQAGITLQPNTEYRLTFDAYSNAGHDFDVNLIKNASPYTNYGLAGWRFDLTSSWQTYSVTFTTGGFTSTVSDGRLWFSLAAYDAAGDVYHLDNVRLARVSDLYPPELTPPAITVQPIGLTVHPGQTATFTIAASGTAPLSFQWQKNRVDIPGATASSYTTPATTVADSGAAFRCIVSNNAGKDTSRAAVLRVCPIPPTQYLVGPGPGSSNLTTSPVLSWRLTPGATSYRLQVSTDSTFVAGLVLDDSTITDTLRQLHGLAFITQYYWHVEAVGTGGEFSATWSFTTIIGPAATPVQELPVNGTAGLAVASVSFAWQPARSADTYRLQIATDSTFAGGVAFDDSTLTDTSRSVTTLRTDQRYYWHVRAKGAGGSGNYSTVWWFETIKTAPLAASLIYPVNGAAAMPTVGLVFRWNSVAAAVHYGFELGTDSTFAAGLVKNDSALVDTTRTVNGLSVATRYFWRVRARNSSNWGPFSPAWSLTTTQPVPGQVALHGPSQSALASADSGTFTWYRPNPPASRYWFEIGPDSTFSAFKVVDSTLTDTVKIFRPLEDGKYYWRVRGWNPGGWGLFSETRLIRVIISSITDARGLPQTFMLEQNHPNPFNPSTQIGFGLPTESQVRLDVYNLLGERMAVVLDERMQPGYHTITFNASNLPSGVYLYRLVTEKGALVRKMVLMK